MIKYNFYICLKADVVRGEECGEVIRGCSTYRAPFSPTDNKKTYVLNGYAIGYGQLRDLIGKGYIKKISKKKAVEILINQLR